MKTYLKFISYIFLKSFFFVFFIFFSLVFILNLLNEIEFLKNISVQNYTALYLSILNTPSLIFEMLPFVILLSTQVFFIRLFEHNEIQIFKYSGLKNTKLILIISLITFILSILIIIIYYNFSANLKKIYLEFKNQYTSDEKYLAVVTKNGLWIKDIIDGKTNLINASKIKNNFLIDVSITQFDKKFNPTKTILSEKVDISTENWIIINPKNIYGGFNDSNELSNFKSNFDYKRIQNLFSDLSSLTLLGLAELRENYINLNYSTLEIDAHIQKIISYPIYLTLMTILSSILMFNSKRLINNTIKIATGLFFCVIIYYFNNLFYIMGITEKIYLEVAIWIPLLLLFCTNLVMFHKINEK